MGFVFDIDNYLNPFVPAPRLNRLPLFISWFLGYRPKEFKPINNQWLTLLSVFISTFTGLIVVLITFNYSKHFIDRGVPVIIPSLGASSILIYNSLGAPLAQPRNFIFGTFISSFVGIVIMRFFMTHADNEQFLWTGAALATACSSVLMSLLDCVHPPAGAAALLPLVDTQIRELSWYYLPVQLISMGEMLVVACLMNNVILKYPAYWWTAKPLAKTVIVADGETEERTTGVETSEKTEENGTPSIVITVDDIRFPPNIEISQEYHRLMLDLQQHLRDSHVNQHQLLGQS
jgi:CBS-domain-containing membrane protein